MIQGSAIAQTYARALFLAVKENKELSLKTVGEDLRLSWRLIQSYPNLNQQLTHAMIPLDKKKSALARALKEVRPQTQSVVRRFLELLLEKKRMEILPAIAAQYERDVLESSNFMKAAVKVAYPLDEKTKEKLSEKLAQFFKKSVTMDVTVAPELLGGIVVKAGDTVLDYSLNSQLKRFGYGN